MATFSQAIINEITEFGQITLAYDRGGKQLNTMTSSAVMAIEVADREPDFDLAIVSLARCKHCNQPLKSTWISNWQRACKDHYSD